MMPLIAVGLAIYGWWLVNRLAKSREAYDLHHSVILLLEQLVVDGKSAWGDRNEKLDNHTELKITSKVAAVEQRLALIQKHYRVRNGSTEDATRQIAELRRNLTISKDQMQKGEQRELAILRLTTVISSGLLEDNYKYMVAGRRSSLWTGTAVLLVLIMLVFLIDSSESTESELDWSKTEYNGNGLLE